MCGIMKCPTIIYHLKKYRDTGIPRYFVTSSIKNFDTVAVYEYLAIQNMFYCIPYPNKCVCSHQNCEATLILSGDITVLRFWRPSWTPSWILERAPVGFTGILGMLFLVVLGMFPEKFSFGICFAPSE